MPQPATLTFTIHNFKSLMDGQGIMQTGAAGSDVTVSLSPSTGTNVTVASDGSITVTGVGAQQLNMTVPGYNALALVFKQLLGSGDPTGGQAFGSYSRGAMTPSTLSVTDNDQGNASWEFFILIQMTNTGQFGIIDPRITNQ